MMYMPRGYDSDPIPHSERYGFAEPYLQAIAILEKLIVQANDLVSEEFIVNLWAHIHFFREHQTRIMIKGRLPRSHETLSQLTTERSLMSYIIEKDNLRLRKMLTGEKGSEEVEIYDTSFSAKSYIFRRFEVNQTPDQRLKMVTQMITELATLPRRFEVRSTNGEAFSLFQLLNHIVHHINLQIEEANDQEGFEFEYVKPYYDLLVHLNKVVELDHYMISREDVESLLGKMPNSKSFILCEDAPRLINTLFPPFEIV